MNIVYVLYRKRISLAELLIIKICDGITAFLARANAGHDDYELRGTMGEWTRDEATREIQAGIDCQEQNRVGGEFWSGG